MVQFVKKAFRVFFVFFLWLTLCGCIFGGGYAGYTMGLFTGDSEIYAILGALLGLVAGMLINIIIGGLVATIINIDDNVEIIKNNIFKTSGINVNNSIPLIKPVINSGETSSTENTGT